MIEKRYTGIGILAVILSALLTSTVLASPSNGQGKAKGQEYPPPFLDGNQIDVLQGPDIQEYPVGEQCYVVHGWHTPLWKELTGKEKKEFLTGLRFELYIDDQPVSLRKSVHHYRIYIGKDDVMVISFSVEFKPNHFETGKDYVFRGEWWYPPGYLDDAPPYTREITVTFTE